MGLDDEADSIRVSSGHGPTGPDMAPGPYPVALLAKSNEGMSGESI